MKNAAELEGIRRAQRAAEAAMDVARDLLRRADASGDVLMLDGEPLTCERIKQEIGEVFTAHDMAADELIVSHGGQSADRSRDGLRADLARRADRHRPLAEGPRDRLPRRHDADVLRRRAAGRSSSSTTGS